MSKYEDSFFSPEILNAAEKTSNWKMPADKAFAIMTQAIFDVLIRKEKERIIKLLEEPLLEAIGQASFGCVDSAGVFDAEEAIAIKDSLIALIKGEN